MSLSPQEGLQHVRGDEDLAAFRQGAMNGKHRRAIRGIRIQLPAHSFLGIVSTPRSRHLQVLTSGSVMIQQGSSCLVVSIAPVGSAQLPNYGESVIDLSSGSLPSTPLTPHFYSSPMFSSFRPSGFSVWL